MEMAETAVAAECRKGGVQMAEPLIELKDIYKIYHMGDEQVCANDASLLPLHAVSSWRSLESPAAENPPS